MNHQKYAICTRIWLKKLASPIKLKKQVDILISKNQALQVLYLKHHNNEYKTSYIIKDKKLNLITREDSLTILTCIIN